jgi:hypothetical protein
LLQPSGQLNRPMLAEEVPPVTRSILAGHALRARCHRVGVKRSREQTNRLVTATGPVRPALEADPPEPVRPPIIDNEKRGADSTTNTSRCTSRLPARPPFLMRAALAGATTSLERDMQEGAPSRNAGNAPAEPNATRPPIHGLLSSGTGASPDAREPRTRRPHTLATHTFEPVQTVILG